MKLSAQWNYGVRIGLTGKQSGDEKEIQWSDLPPFTFEGVLNLPTLPREGMRISMPDNGPETGETSDVYMTVDENGRWGYRVIIHSCLNVCDKSAEAIVDTLQSVLPLEFEMLRKSGFSVGGVESWSSLLELVFSYLKKS